MKSMYDIQQLLKTYGIFIYTGDRTGDLQLMDIEINELYKAHMLAPEKYAKIKRILQMEINKSKHKG